MEFMRCVVLTNMEENRTLLISKEENSHLSSRTHNRTVSMFVLVATTTSTVKYNNNEKDFSKNCRLNKIKLVLQFRLLRLV